MQALVINLSILRILPNKRKFLPTIIDETSEKLNINTFHIHF